MSVESVYLMAEQPVALLDALCASHEIVLSRKILCRALAIQIAEELDPSIDLPPSLASMAIPELLALLSHHQLLLDLYALKLKLWMVLYHHRDILHLEDSFANPVDEPVGEDTLEEILQCASFQDSYGEWMGQAMTRTTYQDDANATPKVDVIDVSAPDIPVYEDEEFDLAFGENPELASLVSDVLAAETSPKKRRSLFASLRKK